MKNVYYLCVTLMKAQQRHILFSRVKKILFVMALFWVLLRILPSAKDNIMGVGSIVIVLILMEPACKAKGKDIYK